MALDRVSSSLKYDRCVRMICGWYVQRVLGADVLLVHELIEITVLAVLDDKMQRGPALLACKSHEK